VSEVTEDFSTIAIARCACDSHEFEHRH